MARRALTDDERPFACARTVEEWTALVPEEHRSAVDVEWLRVALGRVDSSIRPQDVERAARQLSPGAFRIVQALTGAGLLARTGGDSLRAAPRWIARAAEIEAERQLLSGSAFEWGEALLRPHAAQQVAARLSSSIRAGGGALIADVLELQAEESPAHASAVETAFRAVGLALLSGAELDHESLLELWEAASELWVRESGWPPLPRIEHPAGLGVLFHRGTYFLVALALGETLGKTWPSKVAGTELLAAYDAMLHTLEQSDGSEPWLGGAARLFDRRYHGAGRVSDLALHPLELPSVLLDRATAGELGWADLSVSSATGRAVFALSSARAEGTGALANAAFAAWAEAGCPEVRFTLLDPREAVGRALFAAAPPELAVRLLCSSPDEANALVEHLPTEAWPLLADTPLEDPSLRDALARALPEAWANHWLERPAVRALVWTRHPELARQRLHAFADTGDVDAALALAADARVFELAPLLPALEASGALQRTTGSTRQSLRRSLHGWIGRRLPGWREAYSAFCALEA
jgi:hypothetical protein